MANKIGLFGGSFDPPTKAHLKVAEELIRRGVVDEVEFVPAYISYHGKNYGASPTQRIDMLELLIESSEYESNLRVNPFEIVNQMKSSTCDFVEKFLNVRKPERNDTQYYFIVGMDNAKKIPRFRNAKKLMSLIPFIVVNRGKSIAQDSGQWYNEEPNVVVNIGDTHEDCSSTNIRDAVMNMEYKGLPPQFFDWCVRDVFAYILNYNLYDEEE